jgi:DNA polymerase
VKAAELKQVERAVSRLAKRFPLAKRAVPGEGPSNAKVMLIGEAPGPQENVAGRPFVGRSGKFLDKLLRGIGLPRKKVFITGMVKFYPGRRAPTKKEIELFKPLTMRQIGIIKPQLVVLLGNVAVKAVLGQGLNVSEVHGKAMRIKGRWFFPTVHPAAAMRFPSACRMAERDFERLGRLLRELGL